MRNTASRIASMALGLLVALAIMCSQFFYLPQATFHKKEIKTDQAQNESSEDQIYFSVPSTTLPSSVLVELNPNVFLLFEILFEEKVFETPGFSFEIPLSQCFRTLFGLAISPNAP